MFNVLIVDDEALIRRGLKKIIPWKDLGFEVIGEAENGEDALTFIKKNNVDIVLSDLRMPVMEGTALAENIHSCFSGIKVIILTGFDDFHLIRKCLREGVADYLLKPVKKELLIETLLKVKHNIEFRKYPYPFEMEKRIILTVDNGDANKVEETIQELFMDFLRQKTPVAVIRLILIKILLNIDFFLTAKGLAINTEIKEAITDEKIFSDDMTPDLIRRNFHDIVHKILLEKTILSGSIIPQVKNYIEKNISNDLTLKSIASEFLINPSYLSHIFKKETGIGYIDYVISLRIEKAKKILSTSNCSIDTVSTIVGYNDYRYFSRIFKKHTNMTPSEFSRKYSTGI